MGISVQVIHASTFVIISLKTTSAVISHSFYYYLYKIYWSVVSLH